MSFWPKRLFTLLLFVLMMGAVYLSLKFQFEPPKPKSGLVNPLAQGLGEPNCQEKVEENSLVYVKTTNELEAYYCWGKIHGKYRGWQADYLRRVAQGRLSEVHGYEKLKQDMVFRIMNFYPQAQEMFSEMKYENQKLLWAFTFGMNHGLRANLGEGESLFRLFNYFPDEWNPIDTVALMLLKSFIQTRKTLAQDIIENRMQGTHGNDLSDVLEDDGMPWETTIIKESEVHSNAGNVASIKVEKSRISPSNLKGAFDWFPLDDYLLNEFLKPNETTGSNNWVVSPGKTENGFAILANDPHLELERPPLVFWSVIDSGEWKLFGGSVPGLPVVISGTNENVAWGITNAYMNCADGAYIPQAELSLKTENPNVVIKIAGMYFNFDMKAIDRIEGNLRILPLEAPKDHKLVVKWSGFHLKAKDIEGAFLLPRTKTAREHQTVVRTVRLPAWNFVIADKSGNIAYQMTGLIPRMTEPPPFGVPTVSLEEFKKWSFLRDEERPSLYNPTRGYIATSNNRHWPGGSPLHGGRAYYHPFRAQRIEDVVSKGAVSVENSRKLQCEVLAPDSRFFIPLLGKHLGEDEFIKELTRYEILDFKLNCDVCSGYRYIMSEMKRRWEQSEPGLYKILSADVLDKKRRTDLEKILKDMKKSHGGKGFLKLELVHKSDFPHLSGDKRFPGFAIPTGGDDYSVAPGTSNWLNGEWNHWVGAAHRIVIEMKDRPQVHGLLVGENFETKHQSKEVYLRWQNCELNPINF